MTLETKIRVLIVEDSAIDAEEIVSELESAGLLVEAERVDNEDDFDRALKRNWDVVIYDYVVPGMDWRQSLIKVHKHYPHMPLIIVSGKRGEEYAVETMRAGCCDYVVKDRLVRLAPAVIREFSASAERSRNEQKRRVLELELQRSRRLEATGRLANGLAHNLNNVLLVIMAGLDLVLYQRGNDDDRPYLEDAARAVESAAKMVRQLAELGREPEFRPASTSIKSLIQHVDVLVRPILKQSVSLTTQCDPGIPAVRADIGQLEHALLNLVLNARDAVSDEGHIRVDAIRENEHTILLRVGDDGDGVPKELRERIFEPFFSTKGEGGTGLGLSTVYQTARVHGGSVSIKSGDNGGSVFELRLPLVEAPSDEVSEFQAWTEGSGTILILDDAEDALLAARGILERCGYEVKSATSLNDARNVLKRIGSADAILAETMMRDGGARELLHWLDETGRSIPVVAISAFQSERWERYRFYEGFAAFLPKPFNGLQLSETVARARRAKDSNLSGNNVLEIG